MNVCGGLVSTAPFAEPPLSTARTVTLAVPRARSAGVYVSVPFDDTAGATEKSPGLSFVTVNVTV